jgi:hypothetical protein
MRRALDAPGQGMAYLGGPAPPCCPPQQGKGTRHGPYVPEVSPWSDRGEPPARSDSHNAGSLLEPVVSGSASVPQLRGNRRAYAGEDQGRRNGLVPELWKVVPGLRPSR